MMHVFVYNATKSKLYIMMSKKEHISTTPNVSKLCLGRESKEKCI